jgi:hypothetical protein
LRNGLEPLESARNLRTMTHPTGTPGSSSAPGECRLK